jgi:hypothetical protein
MLPANHGNRLSGHQLTDDNRRDGVTLEASEEEWLRTMEA